MATTLTPFDQAHTPERVSVHRPRLDTPSYPFIQATDEERELRYAAALKLVERIESNLRCSRRCLYWRISDKKQLTTVMEVVNAILSDDLLLPEEPVPNGN